MKSNFSYIQMEMNSITENMANIAKLSNQINDKLLTKRVKLKDLLTSKSTLSRVCFYY